MAKALVPKGPARQWPPGQRATLYTTELAEEICTRLACGEMLIEICVDEHMPAEYTVRKWYMFDEPGKPWEGFSTMYARARAMQVEHELEQIEMISKTPVAGEITTVKGTADPKTGELVEIKEVRYEDMLGHRRLLVDTKKWRISKIARHKYGDKASDTDAAPDDSNTAPVAGGLPDNEP